jgi:hypothetical protein
MPFGKQAKAVPVDNLNSDILTIEPAGDTYEPQTEHTQGAGSRALLGATMAYAVLFGSALVAVARLPGATQTEAQVVSAEVKRTRRFRGGRRWRKATCSHARCVEKVRAALMGENELELDRCYSDDPVGASPEASLPRTDRSQG